MTRRLPLVLLALAAVVLAACGERKEPTGAPPQQRLRLMLDYFPNADHAGIYAAKDSGAFSRAGLDVQIQTPSDPAAPLKLLAAGKVDLAISYEPELLLARDKGLQLVAVGALVQKPLTSIISIGKHAIADPKDLKGKTVGTAGIPYQSAYLKTILDRAGVDPSSVKEVNVGFNLVPAMKTKKVDATLGAFWNYEGVQLRLEKQHPQIIRMENVGVPTYQELVIVARRTGPGQGRRAGAALHARARSGPGGAALGPRGRSAAAAQGQPRPRPQAAARERQGHPARSSSRRRASRSAGWTAPSGRATATGCTPTSCSAARPTRRAR